MVGETIVWRIGYVNFIMLTSRLHFKNIHQKYLVIFSSSLEFEKSVKHDSELNRSLIVKISKERKKNTRQTSIVRKFSQKFSKKS